MADPNPSLARKPSGVVLLNGTQVPWMRWSVTNNGYYRADTYSLVLPTSALPKGLQSADLADTAKMSVEIRCAVDGSSPVSLITGGVDDLSQSWEGGTISLSGRDRTADFLDAKTAEKFQNQTSSQIIQTLAGRHGMTADVEATSTPSGRYYEIDHDRLTDETTEWDLITYLAQKEGYFAWVSGSVLHFRPASEVQGKPVSILWTPASSSAPASSSVIGLTTQRSFTLAPDVQVIVWTWNHKQKTHFKVTAKGKKTGKSKSSGPPQTYTFVVPGLTRDQAQQLAQNKLEEITRHERVLDLTMVPDVTLTPRNQLQLQGTATSWDQAYWVDEVVREMAQDEFTQTVKAKNHSPQTTVNV